MRQPKLKRTAPVEEREKLIVLMDGHLEWMLAQNFSGDTVITRRSSIGYFLDWCRERGIAEPGEITRP